MVRDRDCGDFKDIPWEAWEILQGVNLFSEKEITPEPSADPMICSPDISLNKNELAFLKRGPRFMMRQEMNEKDFRAELEKMTVKEKFNELPYSIDVGLLRYVYFSTANGDHRNYIDHLNPI